jgi:ATP-dependent DNA helicase DinG
MLGGGFGGPDPYDPAMLEASAHLHLKALLAGEGQERWPHHLTLCRLVARSLRRGDHTLIRLAAGSDPGWLISLLVPLTLVDTPVALVVDAALRRRLLQQEWPRLRAAGLERSCWEGSLPPPDHHLWLLDPAELLTAWRNQRLGDRQLVVAGAEAFEQHLREAMAVRIQPADWDQLRRALPRAEPSLLSLHERLSRRVLGQPRHPHHQVALAPEDEAPLRQLLTLLEPLPDPWQAWLKAAGTGWASWATVDAAMLQWQLHRQPLAPLEELDGLLRGRGAVLIGELPRQPGPSDPARVRQPVQAGLNLEAPVVVDLGDPPLSDPLPLYCPLRQPLPNSPLYGEHLLDQCRRLILGQEGLTVILLDDDALRLTLTSSLAAEFGSRVVQASTAPESHGVVCASWSWWLDHQPRLPLPCQVVVALLPIASLEDPLTAARVEGLRRAGGDWFRTLLLPEAINRLQRGVACLRRSGGRLAVLDGRVRGREWGRTVFAGLEPWVQLPRLLPN